MSSCLTSKRTDVAFICESGCKVTTFFLNYTSIFLQIVIILLIFISFLICQEIITTNNEDLNKCGGCHGA